MCCFRLKSLFNYRRGAAGLLSNVLFLSPAVLYVLFPFLLLHLCNLNTSLELLLFICSEQYNKYEEKKKFFFKKSTSSKWGKDNEIEKKSEHRSPCLRYWEFILSLKSLCWKELRTEAREKKNPTSAWIFSCILVERRCESRPQCSLAGFLATLGFPPLVYFTAVQLSYLNAAFIFVLSRNMWNLRSKSWMRSFMQLL